MMVDTTHAWRIYSRHFIANAIVILLFVTHTAASASIEHLADVPVPANTSLQVVADRMIHNGNRLSLASYTSSLPLEESVGFYRGIWLNANDGQLPGMIETQVGEWLLISRLRNGYNTVIQLKLSEAHKSIGFVSIMPVPGLIANEPFKSISLDVNALDGLELISSTQTEDGRRHSLLSVYSTSHSVDATTRQYIEHLIGQNWVVVSRQVHAQSNVVLLNRKTQKIELVVSGDATRGGAVLVVNEINDHG